MWVVDREGVTHMEFKQVDGGNRVAYLGVGKRDVRVVEEEMDSDIFGLSGKVLHVYSIYEGAELIGRIHPLLGGGWIAYNPFTGEDVGAPTTELTHAIASLLV